MYNAQSAQSIEGIIHSLMTQLAALAPAPNQADNVKSVSGAFNFKAAKFAAAMQAYLKDLPRRRYLEQCIALYKTKMNSIPEEFAPIPVPVAA